MCRTGLPLSTYFSAIKLRWMIDNDPQVAAAHDADDLLFGTVESWVVYVSDPIAFPSLMDDFGDRPYASIFLVAFRRTNTSAR
jgi:hypothetical protein